MPVPTVGSVTEYGVTLDASAKPSDVLYVLLRAIKDDIEAGDDVAAREEAFRRQLATAATETIYQYAVLKHLGRDECVRRITWNWAPILGYYVADFPADRASTEQRSAGLSIAIADKIETEPSRHGLMLNLNDPSGDPNASVVAEFEFFRENGFWRISQVGFAKDYRRIPRAPARPANDASTPAPAKPD